MRPLYKIIAVLIVIILIASSAYAVFFAEPRCGNKPKIDRYDEGDETAGEDGDEGDNENGNGDGNGGDATWDTSHFVFIEEATGSWCQPCVNVAQVLKELYESDKYPFYYVSLIGDQENTKQYLTNHYNILAYPTVYIDGGYKILMGGATDKSSFENNIKSALSRDFSSIYINVSAEWDENKSQISIEGIVKNDGDNTYSGSLRVYLTEIISTEWLDFSKKQYHFGFLEFIIDKSIEIPSHEIYNFSKTIDDSGLDPDNLMIFAVIFNSKAVKKYSDPEDLDFNGDKHEFKAYYADNAAGALVVEGGNLPPIVGISIPEAGKLHISGKPVFKFIVILAKKTILIGKMIVNADVEDDLGIEKVEFYLDGDLQDTDEEEPYEFSIKKAGLFRHIIPRKHTITVTAYDVEGKTNTADMEVITFFF